MTLTLQQLFSMDQYKMSAMIKNAVIWIPDPDPKPIIMDEDYLQRVMKANPDTYYVKRLAQQNIMQKSIHYTVGCYGEDEHILKWYVIPKSTLRCLIPEKMYKISDLLKSNKEGEVS